MCSMVSICLRRVCVRGKKIIQPLAAIGLAVLLLSLSAFPQLNLGSIEGTVTDPSGAVILGAKVTVTDVERGVSRTLTTDNAGQYSATRLTPGQHTVRAESTGLPAL